MHKRPKKEVVDKVIRSVVGVVSSFQLRISTYFVPIRKSFPHVHTPCMRGLLSRVSELVTEALLHCREFRMALMQKERLGHTSDDNDYN
eukprot:1408055-Amphidinium_carterae.1